MSLQEITSEQQFEEQVLQNEDPVAVNLYFTTCPECQQAHKIIEEDNEGVFSRLKILQKEVTDKKSRPSWVGKVRSVPAFLIYKHGEEIERLTSSADKKAVDKLSDWINSNL